MTTAKLSALFSMLLEQAGLIDKPGIGFGMHCGEASAGKLTPEMTGVRTLRMSYHREFLDQPIHGQIVFPVAFIRTQDQELSMRMHAWIIGFRAIVDQADEDAQKPKLITDPLAFGGPINHTHN